MELNVLFLFASGYTLLLSKRNLSFEDEKFNGMELLEGSKYHLYTNIDEIIQSGSPAPIWNWARNFASIQNRI